MKELANATARLAGIQQTMKGIQSGRVQKVYVALDADPDLLVDVRAAAALQGLPLVEVPAMKALGRACGIQVKAAAAAILKG